MNPSDKQLLERIDISLKEVKQYSVDLKSYIKKLPKLDEWYRYWFDSITNLQDWLKLVRQRFSYVAEREALANNKLSEAEYHKRDIANWKERRDALERKIADLLQEAVESKMALVKQSINMMEKTETDRKLLSHEREQLKNDRQQLGQYKKELNQLRESSEHLHQKSQAENRAALEFLGQAKESDHKAEQHMLGAEVLIAQAKHDADFQSAARNEVARILVHYQDRLRQADELKRLAADDREAQAKKLQELQFKIRQYDNKEYLLKRREQSVLHKWNEVTQLVKHNKLPVDISKGIES